MVHVGPSANAPINRRGGRGRGRAAAGPGPLLKASRDDADDKAGVLPELAQFQRGKRQDKSKEGALQNESTELPLYPPIPKDRMPPYPITIGIDVDKIDIPVHSDNQEEADQKAVLLKSMVYPKPTRKQIEMRLAFENMVTGFQNSDYHLNFSDLENGGKEFKRKTAWMTTDLRPEYYPRVLTDVFKRRREEEDGVPSDGLQQTDAEASRRLRVDIEHHKKLARAATPARDVRVLSDLETFARLEKLEETEKDAGRHQPELEEENDEELDGEEGDDLDEQYDGDDPYQNFDDDDDGRDDDGEGNENSFY